MFYAGDDTFLRSSRCNRDAGMPIYAYSISVWYKVFLVLDVFLRFPFLNSGLLTVFYPGFMWSGIRVSISLPYVRVLTLHEVFHLVHVTDYTII